MTSVCSGMVSGSVWSGSNGGDDGVVVATKIIRVDQPLSSVGYCRDGDGDVKV